MIALLCCIALWVFLFGWLTLLPFLILWAVLVGRLVERREQQRIRRAYLDYIRKDRTHDPSEHS